MGKSLDVWGTEMERRPLWLKTGEQGESNRDEVREESRHLVIEGQVQDLELYLSKMRRH